jgi:membrane-associated protease RseP (regulator of RpoE activity)
MQITPENMFLLGLLLFWAIIYAVGQILHTDKHGLKILPFFLTYRSEKFKNTISIIGEKNRLLWKTLSNVSTALGLGLLTYVTYFLASNLLKFFYSTVQSVPVIPIVPAVTIRLDSLPYFFAAVAIIVILHELAHGVSAIVEKVSVKSAGLALVLAFFGGFVEPEEQSFGRASKTSKLRIVSAGSAINLVTGLLVLVLLLNLFAPSAGVLVDGTVADGPLARAGVNRFDVITAVNGKGIDSLQSLANYLNNTTPGAVVVLRVNGNNVTVITENLNGRALIGLSYGLNYHPSLLGFDHVTSANLYLTLYWTFLAAFSVAVFNMLPAFPFDGEKFLFHLFEDRVEKGKRFSLRVLINAVFWGLLLANMILSFVYFGLPRA